MSSSSEEITPRPSQVFRPFIETPLNEVKVVFVFPEPHKYGSADGLALSHSGTSHPYVFREFMREVRGTEYRSKKGDLKHWARRGVFLWNAIPTAFRKTGRSHDDLGWRVLTEEILETVYLVNSKTVFVFVGTADYDVLPSDAIKIFLPLPVLGPRNPFRNCRVFDKINSLLRKNRRTPIYWKF